MIVYLHGFNSAFNPSSDKVIGLSTLDTVLPLSYDSYDTQHNIIVDILQKTKNVENLTFVGTSLGGFYAACCASAYESPCVMINPMTKGSLLQAAACHIKDIPMKNFVTNEYKSVTPETIQSYEGLDIANLHYEFKPLLLLDMGDTLIDSHQTYDHLKDIVSKSSVCYPDGNHRFQHMVESLPIIKSYINRCSYISHYES